MNDTTNNLQIPKWHRDFQTCVSRRDTDIEKCRVLKYGGNTCRRSFCVSSNKKRRIPGSFTHGQFWLLVWLSHFHTRESARPQQLSTSHQPSACMRIARVTRTPSHPSHVSFLDLLLECGAQSLPIFFGVSDRAKLFEYSSSWTLSPFRLFLSTSSSCSRGLSSQMTPKTKDRKSPTR